MVVIYVLQYGDSLLFTPGPPCSQPTPGLRLNMSDQLTVAGEVPI